MRPYSEIRFTGTDEEINAQWLEQRTRGVGGSDVAAIMGISKYRSPYEVWLEKTGRVQSPDLSDNQAVEWGNRLEPLVAEKFAEAHPELRVTRRNAMLVSDLRPWAFANIDRQLSDGSGNLGVLEVKTVGSRRASDWEDGVPDYYLTQVTHYLAVTGWGYAYVAALIGGQDYREYRIEPDADDIKAVTDAVDGFWEGFVATDTPPQLIGAHTESSALVGMFPSASDEFVPLLDDDVDGLADIDGIKAEIDRLTKEKRRIEGNIKATIGEHKGIETPTRRITWVRSSRSRFDSKAFEAAHPGLMADYTTTSTTDGGLRVSVKNGA